jgi:uncharacterized protein YecT (DUF1311 family)
LQTSFRLRVGALKLHCMKYAALLIAILVAVNAWGQDERKHPIDRKIAAAEEKAGSTAEMRQTYVDGLQMWDAELNRIYAELKQKLKPKNFAGLQNAQRQWIAYRDAQVKFLNELYSEFNGTMYIPMRAAAEMEITRSRAVELGHQLEIRNEHAGG